MVKKMAIGIGILVGVACVVATAVLGYISYNQKIEIQYLQDSNAILQKDYEEVSKELQNQKAENASLKQENSSLSGQLEEKEEELSLVNQALQIAKDAINSLQANNKPDKDKNQDDENDGDKDKQNDADDVLTEKDLQTLKEKILAGEMNDYLKDVIGAMNQLQLLKLAREIGLL